MGDNLVEAIAAFTHLPWREASGRSHENHVASSFVDFYRGDDKQPYNCIIYSKEGYKFEIHKVSVHTNANYIFIKQLHLQETLSLSKMFRKIIKNRKSEEGELEIFFPFYNKKEMKIIINFLYSGDISCDPLEADNIINILTYDLNLLPVEADISQPFTQYIRCQICQMKTTENNLFFHMKDCVDKIILNAAEDRAMHRNIKCLLCESSLPYIGKDEEDFVRETRFHYYNHENRVERPRDENGLDTPLYNDFEVKEEVSDPNIESESGLLITECQGNTDFDNNPPNVSPNAEGSPSTISEHPSHNPEMNIEPSDITNNENIDLADGESSGAPNKKSNLSHTPQITPQQPSNQVSNQVSSKASDGLDIMFSSEEEDDSVADPDFPEPIVEEEDIDEFEQASISMSKPSTSSNRTNSHEGRSDNKDIRVDKSANKKKKSVVTATPAAATVAPAAPTVAPAAPTVATVKKRKSQTKQNGSSAAKKSKKSQTGQHCKLCNQLVKPMHFYTHASGHLTFKMLDDEDLVETVQDGASEKPKYKCKKCPDSEGHENKANVRPHMLKEHPEILVMMTHDAKHAELWERARTIDECYRLPDKQY